MLVAKKEMENAYTEQVEKQEKVSVAEKKKKNEKVAYKLIAMVIAMIGLILSLIVLYRYTTITKIRLDISKLEAQKIELEKERDDLLAELESIKSSAKIEEDAFTKLGMCYPSDDQIVYLDVEEPVLSYETNMDELNLVVKLKNMVNLVISLFKGV